MGGNFGVEETGYISAVANAFEGIVVHDSDTRIVFANQKAKSILGIDDNQIATSKLTASDWSLFNEDSSVMNFCDFPVNWVLRKKEKLQNYIVGSKNIGSERVNWYKVNAMPVFSSQNEVEKVVVNFIEIEKDQIQVKEKLRQLIKNSFDMLVLLDFEGNQHFVSDSCEKILGYRPDELTNIKVIDQMLHPEDQQRALSELQNIMKRSGYGGIQYRHRHKNGGWVYLEAFGSNQIDNPYIQAVVLNVRDVTDRKIAEEKLLQNETRLRELNATKDKFFSIIAHDLKTPFHSIVGFCDLLKYQIEKNDYDELGRYATVIQNSSHMAMDLLLNLLEWARSQTGRIKFEAARIDIVSLICKVLDPFFNLAAQKSITIDLDLPNSLTVFADKDMVGTVLRNLISNGIKFTSPGGEIVVSASIKNGMVEVSVADSGVGLSHESMNKLFKIEESYSTPGTLNEKGTGLGLIVCNEFVKTHNGQLWVESQLGKGSTFKFTIPS